MTLATAFGPIQRIRFNPDGRFLAVIVRNESAVHIWDLNILSERIAALGWVSSLSRDGPGIDRAKALTVATTVAESETTSRRGGDPHSRFASALIGFDFVSAAVAWMLSVMMRNARQNRNEKAPEPRRQQTGQND